VDFEGDSETFEDFAAGQVVFREAMKTFGVDCGFRGFSGVVRFDGEFSFFMGCEEGCRETECT
jgi:hypothetical protein